jgi:OOP family OmpA-OmpF porin
MGGFNYEFAFLPRGMALGLFIRRDEADIDAATDTDDNLQYLVTGFSLRHKFLPPPPVPPAPIVAQAAPAPVPTSKKIILRGVNFDFDKSTLRADAIPILDEAARTLKTESSLQVSVEGHTDSRGTDAYNDALSLRRANTVLTYLGDHGVDRSRLTVVGHGEAKPVASNDTDDGRAQNRRVELSVK